MKCWTIGALVFVVAMGSLQAEQDRSDITVRSHDTLIVTVVDQPDLSQKYPVEADGTVTFPLLGRLQVAGLAVEEVTAELEERLAEYFRNPQVRVELERARRVFIFGGVGSPGMYQLTPNMTVLELLARAGYTGASEVIIVRASDAPAPALPDENDTDVIRVNMRDLEKDLEGGALSRNVVLADGDTVYVPRFDPNRIYVSGQVNAPGAFSVPEGTTVLQALALAGGPTDRASLGRVRIVRVVDGEQQNLRVRLEDEVRPGDTIVVPGRIF